MAKKHLVPPLPDRDRQETLNEFLAVLDRHPNLHHFRALAQSGNDRQLALFAALERAVLVGVPATAPPNRDDDADQLLCDILDVIDQHPDLKRHCAYYGPDRHLAILQALGVWRGPAPLQQPSARELFATTFSHRSADPADVSPTSSTNNSPAPQDFRSGGELIGLTDATPSPSAESSRSPQAMDGVLVVALSPNQEVGLSSPEPQGIIRHGTQTPGEKSRPTVPVGQAPAGWPAPTAAPDSPIAPHRPVRRGRPIKLDDLAKGRLLGLMSYGLSFRQAAAQLGVHHQTLLNALKRDEEFAQQVSEARLDAISQPLLTVVQASRTSWRAAAWLAKFLEDRRARTYETTPEERLLSMR